LVRGRDAVGPRAFGRPGRDLGPGTGPPAAGGVRDRCPLDHTTPTEPTRPRFPFRMSENAAVPSPASSAGLRVTSGEPTRTPAPAVRRFIPLELAVRATGGTAVSGPDGSSSSLRKTPPCRRAGPSPVRRPGWHTRSATGGRHESDATPTGEARPGPYFE